MKFIIRLKFWLYRHLLEAVSIEDLLELLFGKIYTPEAQSGLLKAVDEAARCVFPSETRALPPREFLRVEASKRAVNLLPSMRDRDINLGCELAYRIRRK